MSGQRIQLTRTTANPATADARTSTAQCLAASSTQQADPTGSNAIQESG
jgi:hypothetical protein